MKKKRITLTLVFTFLALALMVSVGKEADLEFGQIPIGQPNVDLRHEFAALPVEGAHEETVPRPPFSIQLSQQIAGILLRFYRHHGIFGLIAREMDAVPPTHGTVP